MRKCGLKTLCKTLNDNLGDHGEKGIIEVRLMNIKTMKPSRNLICYSAASGRKSKPIIMNVCPWCKGNLRSRAVSK